MHGRAASMRVDKSYEPPKPEFAEFRLVTAEHELSDRQDQSLDTQKQGVHKADGVDRMQGKPLDGADIL